MVNRVSSMFNVLMGLIAIASPFISGYEGPGRLVMIGVGLAIIAVALGSLVVPQVKLPNGMTVATKTANVAVVALLIILPFAFQGLGFHYATSALVTGIFITVMVATTSALPHEVLNHRFEGAIGSDYSFLEPAKHDEDKHSAVG